MESCSIGSTPSILCPTSSNPSNHSQFPTTPFKFTPRELSQKVTRIRPSNTSGTLVFATLRSSKGFGSPPKKNKKRRKEKKPFDDEEDDEDEDEEDEGDSAGIIPEIVTNRMINRMAFSVGIPLMTGLLFFPFFYYLKVGLKIDVPTWIPFIVSFFFFGSALLGVSYGIVSSSWDPLREGSLLGWNEAKKNWPVFWQSLRNGGSTKG